MHREKIIPKILEILQTQAEATADLFDILTSNYADSYRKTRKTIKSGPPRFKTNWAEKYEQRQRFYSLLNKLKNQGLVEKHSRDKEKTIWQLTKKGLGKLAFLKKEKTSGVAKPSDYESEKGNNIKIIIFDIPEKERKKRDWLREVISAMGFSLLQRSVWIGKCKVSERFLGDLKKLDLLSYVHIFEISKTGTINSLL